ncbi:MAG: nuclear transport factor 2 family protein [Candidatus Eremiobacteraeota bacterium]|nr:nuclear transport factor 2 family protein [Candidatus Eremiobacteraeota bacterium]
MRSSKEEAAVSLFDAISKGDFDRAMEHFDEKGSLVFPGTAPLSGTYKGKEAVRKYFRRMHIAVPDLAFTILHIAESGKVAIIEWINRGKTRRGGPYENRGVTVLEFEGEKIWELRDYLDTEKLKGPGEGSPGQQRQ